MWLATCPFHLSRCLWRTPIISSVPSFWSNEAEGVSSQSLVPQNGTDPVDHGMVIASESLHVRGIRSPHLAAVEHNRADAGREHLAVHLRWEVSGDKDGQEFPELSPGHVTTGANCTVTAPVGAQHVTQVAESDLTSSKVPCRWHPIESLVFHWWAEPYTWGRHRLGCHQSIDDAAAPLVDPQHALWTLDGIVTDTTTTNSVGYLLDFLRT